MPKTNSFLRLFTETGPLVALAVAIALMVGIAAPASAQFFFFGGQRPQVQQQAPQRGFGGGGWFGIRRVGFSPKAIESPKAK